MQDISILLQNPETLSGIREHLKERVRYRSLPYCEGLKVMPAITRKNLLGAKPIEASAINLHPVDLIAWKSFSGVKIPKVELLGCGQYM